MKKSFVLNFPYWGFSIDVSPYLTPREAHYNDKESILRALELLRDIVSRYEVFYVRTMEERFPGLSLIYNTEIGHFILQIGKIAYSVDYLLEERSPIQDRNYVNKLIDEFISNI